MKLSEKYPFKYETHMHTNESSACAHASAADMVNAYKKAGYTGVIITDHHFGGNTSVDRSLPWEQWVDDFCRGYELAKAEGDRIGLDVFFGWESGFNATEFLVYGLDKQWMKKHPELAHITVQQQYELVKQSGGMVVHAHPFRERSYIPAIRLFPGHVDAVEGINASHSGDISVFNDRAIEYANKHRLPITAGSDAHATESACAGVAFSHRLNGIQDFIECVKKNKDYCVFNANEYFKFNG